MVARIMPGNRVDDPDPVRLEPAAQPALRAVEDDQHQARDDRRDGERQVDDAVRQRPAPEPLPGQHQGQARSRRPC